MLKWRVSTHLCLIIFHLTAQNDGSKSMEMVDIFTVLNKLTANQCILGGDYICRKCCCKRSRCDSSSTFTFFHSLSSSLSIFTESSLDSWKKTPYCTCCLINFKLMALISLCLWLEFWKITQFVWMDPHRLITWTRALGLGLTIG